MRMLIGKIVEMQKALTALCHEAKVESATLQAVCSVLFVEIANLAPEPRGKLGEMLASIQGAASTVSENTGSLHQLVTIEHICSMAEALMPEA